MESHPEGLLPGQIGWNPRHHGVHFDIQIRPNAATGWNLHAHNTKARGHQTQHQGRRSPARLNS